MNTGELLNAERRGSGELQAQRDALVTENAKLHSALEAADYYILALCKAACRIPVRDLDEACSSYEARRRELF